MKPLKEMLLTVAEKVMAYLTQRSKMCEQKRDMQKHVTRTLKTEQLKTIHDLKNKSKTYYSRTMKHEVRKKILRLGIIKPCQANIIIKDLLGDKSAASNECQKNVLDCLHLAIESGEDIVVDLHHNNGENQNSRNFGR